MAYRFVRFTTGLLAVLLSSVGAGGIVRAQDDPHWAAARAAGTIEAYETYLRANPTGPYAAEAFRAIVQISRGFSGTGASAGYEAQGSVAAPGPVPDMY